MYLKSIEVQGFKSFANKMKFQFHNGITGIVGPNGSGKSNVADAVRWVLGEQSVKQLRGSNMQDVIFSGTENRKPLGYAMVAITLDNSDHRLPISYDEVTVTRRLYRSGESEYLINGGACRLRDIRELFYDTGIGKEGYSIIGQGQIDRILSGKPEERRELFDEAAGIVKFKRRKLSAQKKLEDENNNLTRINDILTELSRQLGPLERQSEKAKTYLKKREELKQVDIQVFLLENRKVSSQLKEAEEKIAISEQDMARVREELDKTKEEYDRAELELEKLDGRIEDQKNTLNQGQMVRQQLENQIALIREQIHFASANGEQFQSRMTELEKSVSEHESELEKSRTEAGGLKAELEKAREEEACQEARLKELIQGTASQEEENAAKQAQLIDLLNERTNTKSKIQRYDAMTEQIGIRKAQLTRQLLESGSELDQRNQIHADYQKQLQNVQENISRIGEAAAQIEQGIEKQQKLLVEQTRLLEDTRDAWRREGSRLESLRNLAERYDGYGNSIRRVMEQKNKVPGIYGVVADLIHTEKKYETAIETALGGSIQNIVTDHENTAKTLIEYLKKNRYGRATFLPLSAIRKKGGIGSENALYEPGALGVASTLAETEPQYENLIEYLLGKTLVVDHIDHAIAISRKYRQSLRIVTLDGDLLSPGGSMSGGAFKNSSNLLGRRREMEELEEKVHSLKEKTEELSRKLEMIRQERDRLRQELVRKTEETQKEYLNQNTLKTKLQELNTQKDRTKQEQQRLQNEVQELDGQVQEIAGDRKDIETELEQSLQEEKKLEEEILKGQKLAEEQRAEQERVQTICSEYRARTSALEQKEDFLNQNVHRIEAETRKLLQEKQELLSGMQQSRRDADEKEQQIREIQTTIEAAFSEEQKLTAEVEKLGEQRRLAQESRKKFFSEREEISTQMSSLDRERVRLDNQKERLSDYLERQISYMWEEYEMTASEAESFAVPETEDLSSLKKQVSRLKGEIKGLGSVNVQAIEEYKEVHERHTFLTGQHKDLVEAGEALKKIIDELDEGMRRQFTEQFAIMQTEFQKSFRELFGGGKGTLELVEDEDILEAGIRIIAQPPGKKLQNMMQMSGGEKALTAIALLFAIQNMKPSPFCLLDEIEAALDENNVSRYANYLHKLTKNTQFIIITHRRGTMAVADRLYGITMQEKGVSTQVSVNMVESELDK